MAKSGLDLYYSLSLLSTCLGHKSLQSTERYVRLTAEIYQDLLKEEKGFPLKAAFNAKVTHQSFSMAFSAKPVLVLTAFNISILLFFR